jgi:hypothetical protein
MIGSQPATPHFAVFLRACDVVNSDHGAGRPFGLSKLETIKVCVHSLIRALEGHSYSMLVIGDGLSPAAVAFFGAYPSVQLRQEQILNAGKTALLQTDLGLQAPDDDWVYFVEDDYLHTRDAIQRIATLVTQRDEILDTPGGKRNWWPRLGGNVKERPLFIYPADYPDRYQGKNRRPSYVFAAPDGHWRQISNTTHTYMAQGRTLRRFGEQLRAASMNYSDGLLSRTVYGGLFGRDKALCVSPIPGFATHFTDGVMTPFVDWAAEVERNRTELIAAGLW